MKKVINILFVAVILAVLGLFCLGDRVFHHQATWSGPNPGAEPVPWDQEEVTDFDSQCNVNYKTSGLTLWRLRRALKGEGNHLHGDGLIFRDPFAGGTGNWTQVGRGNWTITEQETLQIKAVPGPTGWPSKFIVKDSDGLGDVTLMVQLKVHTFSQSGWCPFYGPYAADVRAGLCARLQSNNYGYGSYCARREVDGWGNAQNPIGYVNLINETGGNDGANWTDNIWDFTWQGDSINSGPGLPWLQGNWYWLKMKVTGAASGDNNHYFKIWQVGTSEPGSWTMSKNWGGDGKNTGGIGLEGFCEADDDQLKVEFDDFVCYYNDGVWVTGLDPGQKVKMFVDSGISAGKTEEKTAGATGEVQLGQDFSYGYDGLKVHFEVYDNASPTPHLMAKTRTTREPVWGGAEFIWEGEEKYGGYFTITSNTGGSSQLRRLSTGKLWHDDFGDKEGKPDAAGWYTDIGSGYWSVSKDGDNYVLRETAQATGEPCHAYVGGVTEDRVYVVAKVRLDVWQNGSACQAGVCARMQTSRPNKGLGYNAVLHQSKDLFGLRVLEKEGEVWGAETSDFPACRLGEWYYIKLLSEESGGYQWQRAKIWPVGGKEPIFWMVTTYADGAQGGRCGLTAGSAPGEIAEFSFDDVAIYKADPIIVKNLPAGTTVEIWDDTGLKASAFNTTAGGKVNLITDGFISPLNGFFRLSGPSFPSPYTSPYQEIWGGDVWEWTGLTWTNWALNKETDGNYYFDDFDSWTLGEFNLSDASANWGVTGSKYANWYIEKQGANQVLRFKSSLLATDPGHAYYKIYPYRDAVVTAKVRVEKWQSQDERAWVGVCGRLGGADGYAYDAAIHQKLHEGTTTRFCLRSGKGGEIDPQDIDDDDYDVGEWFRIKLRVKGNTQQAKIWRLLEPEPEEWTARASESTEYGNYVGVTASGPGLRKYIYDYDDFACYSSAPITIKHLEKDMTVKLYDVSGHFLIGDTADGDGVAKLEVSAEQPTSYKRPVTFPLEGGGYFVIYDKQGNEVYRSAVTGDIWGGDTWYAVRTESDFETGPAGGTTDNWLISRTLDFGTTGQDYDIIKWDADVPAGSEVKFQLATSDNKNGPWNYTGYDGTAGSYYTDSHGAAIRQEESGQYLRYKVFLNSLDTSITPRLREVTIQANPGPPEKIDTLDARARENTVYVDLRWDKPAGGAGGGAKKYIIYRARVPFADPDSAGVTVLCSSWTGNYYCHYCDKNFTEDNSPGKHYYYAVVSIDGEEQKSALSNLADATFLLDTWHIPANEEPFAERGDTMRDPVQPPERSAEKFKLWVGNCYSAGEKRNIVARYKLKAAPQSWEEYPAKLLAWTTAAISTRTDYYLAEYLHPATTIFAKGTTVQYYFKTRLKGPSVAEHLLISEIAVAGGVGQFVELYNPTAQEISLKQWSIQFKPAGSSEIKKTNFGGSIKSHCFFLCAKSGFAGPAPGLAYGFNLASGTVFLVNDNHFISDPWTDPNIVDKVGFGPADVYEQSPAPYPPAGGSIERLPGEVAPVAGNGQDADNNLTDFQIRSVAEPQNSGSEAEPKPGTPAMYQEPTYICWDLSAGKRTTHDLTDAQATPFSYVIDNTAPFAPQPISPGTTYPLASPALGVFVAPEFTWKVPADPDGDIIDSYWVQVATSADFARPKYDEPASETSWQGASLDIFTTYYWRVKAIDKSSYNPYWSTWSVTYWFVTTTTDFLLTDDRVENEFPVYGPYGTTESTFRYWVTYKNYKDKDKGPELGYPQVLIYSKDGDYQLGLPREMTAGNWVDDAHHDYQYGRIYYYDLVLGQYLDGYADIIQQGGHFAYKFEVKVGTITKSAPPRDYSHNPKVGPDLEAIKILCKDPSMFGDVDHEHVGLSPQEDEELPAHSDVTIEAEAIPDDLHEYSVFALTTRWILNGTDRRSKRMSFYKHSAPELGKEIFRCTLVNGEDIHNGDKVDWWVTGRDADSLTDEIETVPKHTFYLTGNFVDCWHRPTTPLEMGTTYYRMPYEITPFSAVQIYIGAKKGKIDSARLYYTTDGSDPSPGSEHTKQVDLVWWKEGVADPAAEYWKLRAPITGLAGGSTVQYFIKATAWGKDDTYLRSDRASPEGSAQIAYVPTSQFFRFCVGEHLLDIYHLQTESEPDTLSMCYPTSPRREDPITLTLGNLAGPTTSHDLSVTLFYHRKDIGGWLSLPTTTFDYLPSVGTTDYYRAENIDPRKIAWPHSWAEDYKKGKQINYYFKVTAPNFLTTYLRKANNNVKQQPTLSENSARDDPFSYVIINTQPDKLTGLSPAPADELFAEGDKTFSWLPGTDVDGNETISGYEWELWSETSTTKIRYAWIEDDNREPPQKYQYSLTGYDYQGGIYYKWRVRAKDDEGAWGLWAEVNFRLKGNPYVNLELLTVIDAKTETMIFEETNPFKLKDEKANLVSNADKVTISAAVYTGGTNKETEQKIRFYYNRDVKDDEFGTDFVITQKDNSNEAQQSNYFKWEGTDNHSQFVDCDDISGIVTWTIPTALLTPYGKASFDPTEAVDSGRLWVQLCGYSSILGCWINGPMVKLLVNRTGTIDGIDGSYQYGDKIDEVVEGVGDRNYRYPVDPPGTPGKSNNETAESNWTPIWHNSVATPLTYSGSSYYLERTNNPGQPFDNLFYGESPTIYLRTSYKDIDPGGAELKFRYRFSESHYSDYYSKTLTLEKELVRDNLKPYQLCFDFWKAEGTQASSSNEVTLCNLPEGGNLCYHFKVTDGESKYFYDPEVHDEEGGTGADDFITVEILQDDRSKPVTYEGWPDAQDANIKMTQDKKDNRYWNPWPESGAAVDSEGKENRGIEGRTGEPYPIFCWLKDTAAGSEVVWQGEYDYQQGHYPFQDKFNGNTSTRATVNSGVIASTTTINYRGGTGYPYCETIRGAKYVPATLCYYRLSDKDKAYRDDDLDGALDDAPAKEDKDPNVGVYTRGETKQFIRIGGVDGEAEGDCKWDGYVAMSRRDTDEDGNGEWMARIPISLGAANKYLYYRIWACNGDHDPQAYTRWGADITEGGKYPDVTPYSDEARDHDSDYGWVCRTIYAGKILPKRHIIITARGKVGKTVKWMRTHLRVIHPVKLDKYGTPTGEYDETRWVIGRIVSQEIGPFAEEK